MHNFLQSSSNRGLAATAPLKDTSYIYYVYIYIHHSYHIISNQIISNHIIYHIKSNHIISFHIISYQIYHSTLVHHPVSNHDRRDADGMRVLSWKGNTTLLDMENIFPGKKEKNGKSTLATKQIAVLLVTSLPSSTKCFLLYIAAVAWLEQVGWIMLASTVNHFQ